mgnify:CR=1 FL=1
MPYEIETITDTIIHDNCLNVMKDIEDNAFVLAFCDPPYNCGCKYDVYDDKMPDNEYTDWCKEWFEEVFRVAQRVIITPGHGHLGEWLNLKKPLGIGCWFKPGNPASSTLGWCCWEPWLYYSSERKILGGPDTVREPVTKQYGVGSHPCPKPLKLLKWLIEKSTKKGDLILDPFSGSGTTCMAARILERPYVGIDLSQKYVEESRERLASFTDIFE